MADYGAHLAELSAIGAGIAAISVDDPARSEPMRRKLGLGFPLLCDSGREAIRAFDLVNPREGDIARPAVFIIDRERRVRFRTVESTGSRVRVSDVIAAARAIAAGREPAVPEARRRAVWPGTMFVRAMINIISRGHGPR